MGEDIRKALPGVDGKAKEKPFSLLYHIITIISRGFIMEDIKIIIDGYDRIEEEETYDPLGDRQGISRVNRFIDRHGNGRACEYGEIGRASSQPG
jgi:hypothetical protein